MSEMRIEVWAATGTRRIQVDAADAVTVDRSLLGRAEKLHLPRYNPEGQLMSYKFHHRRRAMQLLDDRTLAQQDVKEGDVLRIQPEITAGGGAPWS